MITVKQDSELITNYVAANPIPAGERFVVVSDEHQEPAVFALSEDSILYLIKVIDGQTAKLNFGKTSGVVGDGVAVQAFAVTQAADSSLNICIATRGFNKNESSFHLLHNITLPELQAEIPASKIISGHKFPRVYHIFMVRIPHQSCLGHCADSRLGPKVQRRWTVFADCNGRF